MVYVGICLITLFLLALADAIREVYQKQKELGSLTPEERAELLEWGDVNPRMVCPHCQQVGFVRTKAIQKKAGISGAKATGALLTGGVSMLATGLSRKDNLTQAHCSYCNSTWHF